MKILLLTVRADIGGGPEHVFRLAEGLGDAVDLFIACPDEKPYRSRYEGLKNVTAVFDLPHRAFRWRALFHLAREVRRHRIGLIHSHGKGAGLYGRLLALITGRACVHTLHGLHVGEYGRVKREIYLTLERFLGLMTRYAICVSDGEHDAVSGARILPARKLVTIPNGVVVPQSHALPPPDPAGQLRIVSVSRYDYQKNPDLIVDIARVLKARIGPGFVIEVLGEGERLEEMRKISAAAGLDDVLNFAGPHPNPPERFRDADIYLSTSRWEGMPLAVLEAMAQGRTVVASDVVGNRDVVRDGLTGRLYPGGDPESAAKALADLDPEARAQMGKHAWETVKQHHSVERMAKETLALYHRTLEG